MSAIWDSPILKLACAGLVAFAAAGCVEVGLPASGNTTHAPLVPLFGMHDDPAFEDQQQQSRTAGGPSEAMRYPPPKTIPYEASRTAASADADGAKTLRNPVPINEKTLQYGKLAYGKSCGVCHGAKGKGGGTVAGPNKIANVPSLTSKTARNYSDGELYRIITHGLGRMWGYKSQLRPMERWAVVNYVRGLQRAEYPEPWDKRQ